MTFEIAPGPKARRGDRRAARAILRVLDDELLRVRTAALAWRIGIGALLAGLVGFGLIKGRTDVGELAHPYDVVVGLLLLAALAAGASAAVLLMRAAHGRPTAVSLREVIDAADDDPELRGRMAEADASARSLRDGVRLSFASTALLCAGVGVTWYGPSRDAPKVEVPLSTGATPCGEVVQIDVGQLTLNTEHGTVVVDLRHATGLNAVDSCASAQP